MIYEINNNLLIYGEEDRRDEDEAILLRLWFETAVLCLMVLSYVLLILIWTITKNQIKIYQIKMTNKHKNQTASCLSNNILGVCFKIIWLRLYYYF